MAVIIHQWDGTVLVDGKMESGKDTRQQQPTLEEQQKWLRDHAVQPRLQEVEFTEVRPTRRSKPLMEVPAHLRAPKQTKAPAITFEAPTYIH